MTYDEEEKQALEEFIAEERARAWPDFIPEEMRERDIQNAIAEFKDMLALMRAMYEADQAKKAAAGFAPTDKDSRQGTGDSSGTS